MSKRARGFQGSEQLWPAAKGATGCHHGRFSGPQQAHGSLRGRSIAAAAGAKPTSHVGPRPAVWGSDPPVAIPTETPCPLPKTRGNNCCRAGMCLALHTSNRTALRRASLKRMSSPTVAVVIPCFNQGRFLSDALESVLAQTYRPSEIV